MNWMLDFLCGIFVVLVIAHFVPWGRLKSYTKKLYPVEWAEYKEPLQYKILLFNKGIINNRLAYFMQFTENHKSLLQDKNIAIRIKVLRWVHGVAAGFAIVIIFAIINSYRPY